MIKKIAITLVAAVGLALLVGLALPRRWSVERSVLIDAPPALIHPFLFDLRRWQEWSVWTRELDPQVRHTFEGPPDGVGARWLWLGPAMGRGQLEIVQSDPMIGVELDEAIESEVVNAHASIRYTPEGAGTRLTWSDQGTLPPVVGGFFKGLVEAQLGQSLTTGLTRLKALVEALPRPVEILEPGAAPEAADAGQPD